MSTTMTTKFGVSVSDDLAAEIEKPLEYGDSRSERVRELVQLGLEVEEVLIEEGYHGLSQEQRIELVTEAVCKHVAK